MAEENKIKYNQLSVNILIEGMEKQKKGFLTNSFFTLGEERKIASNRFFP